MFAPDDPLAPRSGVFAEPWFAETLALADAMIRAGHFSGGDWAAALGAELARAEAAGQPDNETSYYSAALSALEALSKVSAQDLAARKADWAEAYAHTPHGQPVLLKPRV